MAQVRVQTDDDFAEWPMASSELVGRHWRNSLRLVNPMVPLYWLELRWRAPNWCWRPLAATELTRGTGAVDAGGWRTWPQTGGIVRLDGTGSLIEIRLLDASPPQQIVEDLRTRRRMSSAANVIESWNDGRIWPLGADVTTQPPLEPGDVFVVGDGVYRLLEVGPPVTTDRVGPSLAEPGVSITFDLERRQALIEGNGWDARVIGECVRVTASYALARVSDGDDGGGGWLPIDEAHAGWIGLGGRPDSPRDRLGWERGKFRNQLAQQGVTQLERLFETRRHAGLAELRLGLGPDQITVVSA